MKRKLIRQGAGGYTVYLPKHWVEERGLTAGMEITLEPVEEGLLIAAQRREQKRITELTLTNLTESSIRTIITNAYRSGYDHITVHYNSREQFKILQQVMSSRLIGFEITKSEDHLAIVENVTEPSAEQFDAIVRKLFFSINELFESTGKHISHNHIEIDEIEERIQRYDNFCRRIIIKETMRRKNSEMFWAFLALIVHAQREIYHLNKILPLKLKNETIALLSAAKEIFSLLHRAYIERQIVLLDNVHERQQSDFKHGYLLLQNTKGKESLVVHHLIAAVRQFYLASSPLFGVLL